MHQLTEFVTAHLALSVLFVGLLVLLIVTEFRRVSGGVSDLSTLEVTQLLNHKHAVLVDVREEQEYQQGHIVNAIHIPLGKIDEQSKKLEKYKKRPIITYCRTGQRSSSACSRLHKQGYETVYNLRGGITAWQKDNLPLTTK